MSAVVTRLPAPQLSAIGSSCLLAAVMFTSQLSAVMFTSEMSVIVHSIDASTVKYAPQPSAVMFTALVSAMMLRNSFHSSHSAVVLTPKLCVVSLNKCPVSSDLVPTAVGPFHMCLL